MTHSIRYCSGYARTAAALSILAVSFTATAAAGDYSVQARIPVVGDTGWDYLSFDAQRQRLFISRGDHVSVIEPYTHKLIGTIPETAGVHGIALAEAFKRGFTSNGKSDSVTVFAIDSLKTIKTVAVSGGKPDAIIYDPASRHVMTFNGSGHNISVINPSKLTVIATIALDGRPEFAAADGHGRVYVNLEDKGQIAVIDSKANKMIETWSLGDCEEPTGLALDDNHHRVFSVCQNHKMSVLDTQTGHLVASVPIGAGPDAVAFDPQRQHIFVSNGEGSLSVIHEQDPDHFDSIATVPTQLSARTLAIDPSRDTVFLAAANFQPPAASSDPQSHPRPSVVEGSFTILVVAPQAQ